MASDLSEAQELIGSLQLERLEADAEAAAAQEGLSRKLAEAESRLQMLLQEQAVQQVCFEVFLYWKIETRSK